MEPLTHRTDFLRINGVRKVVLIMAVSLFIQSSTASGAINQVRVTPCGSGTFPATTCTIPATANGNLLVVAWASAAGTTPTIASMTDNMGNFYAQAGNARAVDGTKDMADIWYSKNIKPGATSITITPSPAGVTGAAVIWEFSGADTISPLNQTAVLNSQPATIAPLGASVGTSFPGDVIVSVMTPSQGVGGIYAGNPFTSDSILFGVGWAHMIPPVAGTFSAQWSVSAPQTYASTSVSFKTDSGSAGLNACDLSADGSVNVVDVTLAVNMVLGTMPCSASIQGPGICDIVTVQRVVNAVLGGTCVTNISPVPHSVTLSWAASVSVGVTGYNVYRSAVSGGPYTKINSSTVLPTNYVDNVVQGGQSYYYVLTAVSGTGEESANSTQVQATVPLP